MIKQAYMSECISHFHNGFRERWGLKDYRDPNAPALFVGMYSNIDIQKMKAHQGPKKVMFAGADMVNAPQIDCTIIADETMSKALRTEQPIEIHNISYRSFDNFKPEPLGDKIYCYQSANDTYNREKYRYDLLEKVVNRYGPSKVEIGYHPHTEEEMRDIYRECRMTLQFNPFGGYTSSREMAHMGRPAISNRNALYTYNYTDIDSIFERIDQLYAMDIDPYWIAQQARASLTTSKDWLK